MGRQEKEKKYIFPLHNVWQKGRGGGERKGKGEKKRNEMKMGIFF